jgi:hypothetical protein
MRNERYWQVLCAIALGGLILRLVSLCPYAFFCDVPLQLKCLTADTFYLYFPGYVPLQWLIVGLARCGLPIFTAMWGISLSCGMGSLLYVALAARKAAGEEYSWLAAAVMAFGILPVYFSVSGASYPTDMLCVSGMLFHGWEFLQSKKARSYYLALAWLCFGILMRPLSAGVCCAGMAVLAWHGRDWRAWFVTALAIMLTAGLYLAISIPAYGSLSAMLHASSALSTELERQTWQSKLTNLARFGIYPIYAFHVWLVFVAWVVLKNWRFRKRPLLLFLAAVAGPYLLLLLRYIPHAGYYCLLVPALVVLPACFLPPIPAGRLGGFRAVAATFVVVAACQWFLLRPVATTSLLRGAANAYVLQYTRSGIKHGMFTTLAQIMKANKLDMKLIPPARLDAPETPPG